MRRRMSSLNDKIATQLIVLALVSAGPGAASAQADLPIVLAAGTDRGPGGTGTSPSPSPSPAPSPSPSPTPSPSSQAPASQFHFGATAPVFSASPVATADAATREAVEKLSATVQNSVSDCSGVNNAAIRSCVGDALDEYAAGLAQLRDNLPPQLAGLPDIVANAAQKVRAAKTKRQAAQAVKAAIGAVRKTIALLRADDPVVLAAQTREGNLVAETLQVADNKLEKAVGL
jgi:hypothetical protein